MERTLDHDSAESNRRGVAEERKEGRRAERQIIVEGKVEDTQQF